MNGLAKIRSSLAAFTARLRSRALANGCMRGSRFREVGVGSPGRAGRCVEGACCSTEIFYTSYDYYNCIRACTEDIPPFLFPLSKRAEKYFKRPRGLSLVLFEERKEIFCYRYMVRYKQPCKMEQEIGLAKTNRGGAVNLKSWTNLKVKFLRKET